jgi:hypothetical protein
MSCTTNIIGYRHCGYTPRILLDDYGISLQSASKVNDDKFPTAKAMLDTMIQQSWDEAFRDLTIDGMDFQKILNDVTYGKMDKSGHFTGTKQINWSLSSFFGSLYQVNELGTFYASQLKVYVKTGGATTINLIQGEVVEELYSGAPEDETVITLSINKFLEDKFSIQVITAGEIYTGIFNEVCNCTNNGYWTYEGDTSPPPFVFTFQVRCSKDKHLCKYVMDIAPAVINKILGKYYFKVNTTDVFNNWINSESGDRAVANMCYYDSQYFGISNADPHTRTKGQYQITLEQIQKRLPKPTCKSCMTCNTSGWSRQSQKL